MEDYDDGDYIDDEPREDWNQPEPLIFATDETFTDMEGDEYTVRGYYYYSGGSPVYYLQNTFNDECIEAWVEVFDEGEYCVSRA